MWVHVRVRRSESEPDEAVGAAERRSVPVLTACASAWHGNVLTAGCDAYHLVNGASERRLPVSEPVMSLLISQRLINV